ncbi:hypothetical protein GZH53_18745 [Flavihumibacter sp. R14]|nr:hypothetical protein [Flavihumibacter soli]
MTKRSPIIVKGNQIDDQTRCIHYHSALDIIAIKFKCCRTYYPCYDCHQAEADHRPERWSKEEWDTKAILCGACKTELTIRQYLDCNYTCPSCKAHFNPGCRNHDHLYFGGSI